MSTATSTTAVTDRVTRYREYFDRRWSALEQRQAYNAAVDACTNNAMEALTEGAADEATVWTDLALLASFRFRRDV